MPGMVEWLSAQRGYGCFLPHGGEADISVHIATVGRAGFGRLDQGHGFEDDLHCDRGAASLEARPVDETGAPVVMSRAGAWAAGRRRPFA